MTFFDFQEFAYQALALFANLGENIINFVLDTSITFNGNEYNLFGVMFGSALFLFFFINLPILVIISLLL